MQDVQNIKDKGYWKGDTTVRLMQEENSKTSIRDFVENIIPKTLCDIKSGEESIL